MSEKEDSKVLETAIADAILITINRVTKKLSRLFFNEPRNKLIEQARQKPELKIETVVIALTAGQCEFASKTFLYSLASRYADRFTEMFLMRGNDSGENFVHFQEWHVIACVRASDGRYYASSPANQGVVYLDMEDPYNILTVYEGDSLEELIRNIELTEGGVWPDVEDTDRNYNFDDGTLAVKFFNADGTEQRISISEADVGEVE